MAAAARPVFLHTGWRTAGTWLWSAFRRKEDVLGLYEPLNQSLATLNLRTLPTMRPAVSRSRHPDEQRPYFEEFAPLLSARRPGVAGYRPEFAYESFFMASDDEFPELRDYIESLMRLAESNGRTPVFKFCRTVGRVAWMRRNFPSAVHIFVMRDPCSQWMSAWRLSREDDNPHHLLTPIRILTLHREHPLVASVLGSLRITPDDFVLPTKHAAVRKAVRATPAPVLYRGFLAFWLLTAFLAFPECDFAIETERLNANDYRLTAQRFVESLTGISIDLTDAHALGTVADANDFFGARSAHADALQALAHLEAIAPPRGSSPSPILHEKLSEQIRIAS
ncbi:MAG TPA: hypothetical protein VMD07_00455 [Candidatus Acidoferrales bacterium]|nr:hypothetical protein [Candidatus Acidoferrales bacterium]